MDGIVNVLKPAGMTSHDVVGKLRRIYKTKKVGHTGTLDPDAVGVLPICIGQGTRLVEYLTEKDKVYKVLLKFGQETDTQDASGQIVKETGLCQLSVEEFRELLKTFVGEIQQTPPMYSAIKKNGQPLYKLARQGETVEIEPRNIMIFDISLLMYNQASAMLEVHCGKGTYIRTLCQDIGRAADSSAHMGYLLRSRSGQFDIKDSISLTQLENMPNPDEVLVSLVDALDTMETLVITDEKVLNYLAHGLQQRIEQTIKDESKLFKVIHPDGYLLAIGHFQDEYFKPDKVFKAVHQVVDLQPYQ